jgi:cobalt-zinc-cadmium efflux system membrane fusion protein
MRNNRLLISAIAVVAGCSKGDASPNADTAKVVTTPASAPGGFSITEAQRSKIHLVAVTPTTFEPSIETTGTVAFNGDRSTQVLSPVSGPVTRLYVEVGTAVSRGAPLAAVSSPDFAAAIAAYRKAEATYRNLQRIADQDEQLFKTDAIARRELEAAQTDAASAAADRDAAAEQLRSLGVNPSSSSQAGVQAIVRAPISGVVVERLITPGQLLQAGATPAFTIADLSTVWINANVFEADLPNIRAGEAATIQTGSLTFPGRVDYVAALVDPSSRATSVRIAAQNRGGMLKKDMYVRVTIHSNNKQSGIVVPGAAVLRDDENLPFVFVAAPDNTYNRRRITLGAHVGDGYQVQSGLNPGDKVVAEGALFLQFAESQ